MSNSTQPGTIQGRPITDRQVIKGQSNTVVPITISSASVDNSNTSYTDVHRPGLFMGMITASKLWRACPNTTVSTTTTSTTIPVVSSSGFVAGETVTVGAGTATIASISGNNIVFTATKTTTAADAVVATDGSATARGILLDNVRLRDEFGNTVQKLATMVTQGLVYDSVLLGDKAAIKAHSASATALNNIKFDADLGM